MRTRRFLGITAALAWCFNCAVPDLDVTGKTCVSSAECPGSVCGDAGVCVAPDAALSYFAEVLADNPIVYLRLGEGAGPAAVDEMKHYNGTYSSDGVTYGVPGAIANDSNRAVAFNGGPLVGVAMPPGLDFSGTSPFSVEFWARQTTNQSLVYVVDHDDWQKKREGWDVYLANATASNIGGPTLERWGDAGTTHGSYATYAHALKEGVYHHVVGTFSGKELLLYVDGQVEAESVAVDIVPETKTSWFIGNCGCCGAGAGLVGDLDEVAVYDHALSSDRVSAHYRAAH